MQEHIKVLIVDDEPDVLDFLSFSLKKEGYKVFTASDGNGAIKMAKKVSPNLIILDVMMPGMDGIEACKELRALPEMEDVFIIFLSARAEDYSQIAGLDAGADDYIAKPISTRVLISRINAYLRRNVNTVLAKEELTSLPSGITINRDRYSVTVGTEEYNLPKKEFELLALLSSKPGKVFGREEILAKIWGDDVVVGDRTIDVHIRKLRIKLGDDRITTLKGLGYKFEF